MNPEFRLNKNILTLQTERPIDVNNIRREACEAQTGLIRLNYLYSGGTSTAGGLLFGYEFILANVEIKVYPYHVAMVKAHRKDTDIFDNVQAIFKNKVFTIFTAQDQAYLIVLTGKTNLFVDME